jgi:hypothetical protein
MIIRNLVSCHPSDSSTCADHDLPFRITYRWTCESSPLDHPNANVRFIHDKKKEKEFYFKATY